MDLAIAEFIAETGYPVIAHHHDFSWERQRFMNNSVHDYLAAAFPPQLPSIRHVVINSIQAQQLASRIGVAAMLVPNVMDFDTPPDLRWMIMHQLREQDLGCLPDEYLILQPTRIIQRKGIEHTIELSQKVGTYQQFWSSLMLPEMKALHTNKEYGSLLLIGCEDQF